MTNPSNFGTIRKLSNSGKISGGDASSGYATAGAGVSNVGTITTLANSGAISGGRARGNFKALGGDGVLNNLGTIDMLTNSGTISGGRASGNFGNGGAGLSSFGTFATLTNSGTISGGDAIYSTGSIGSIANSGKIIGNVEIDNQASVTVTGGAGRTFGRWTGGAITIGNGNLTFDGGNTALGDDVEVDGGKGTVINKGKLQIVTLALLAITGSFTQTAGARSAWTLRATLRDNTGRLRSAGARASTAALGST